MINPFTKYPYHKNIYISVFQGNILILIVVTLCGVASSLMTTRYALLLNPIARGLEELRPEGFMNETSCAIILRTALVASTVCIAFVLPFFGKHAAVFPNCEYFISVSCILLMYTYF